MKRRLFFTISFALTIAIIFITHCDKEEGEQVIIMENYWPLTIGNNWRYHRIGAQYWKEVITESYVWAGNTVYKLERDSIGPEESWLVYMNGELRSYYNEAPPCTVTPAIMLKEPIVEGKEWFLAPGDTTLGTGVIEDLNASVTVPAGTFDQCLKVIYQTQSWTGAIWFAPGVGWVQSGPEVSPEDELIEYFVH